ncbi:MAG: glycosyltransferase family 1 protein [Spirochaetales bacterium]|nr:glycosyltransferase family 1 protein [Spirochaetales bacterium]
MKKITILAYYDRLSLFHSLKPFLFSKHSKYFKFTNSQDYVLNKDKNDILIMVRWFLKPDVVDLDFLKKARKKYKRIAFFNGNAGGAINRPEVLPFVDLFYNKALFKDRNLYKKNFYGDEMFSEYHHIHHNIVDENPIIRNVIQHDDDIKKLRLSWNIGVTDFPNTKLRQRIGVLIARYLGPKFMKFLYHKDFWKGACQKNDFKKRVIHGRLGYPEKKTIAHQRRLIAEIIKNNSIFLYGKVNQKQFNKEVKESMITLSPFGWGELCKRDFEAVYYRSLLLKPDMSHLETWPNIFIDGETYVSFKWDLSDMEEKALYYLNNDSKREEIINNAFNNYKEQLEMLDSRFETILEEIIDEKIRG